jgi:hypothetical protein
MCSREYLYKRPYLAVKTQGCLVGPNKLRIKINETRDDGDSWWECLDNYDSTKMCLRGCVVNGTRKKSGDSWEVRTSPSIYPPTPHVRCRRTSLCTPASRRATVPWSSASAANTATAACARVTDTCSTTQCYNAPFYKTRKRRLSRKSTKSLAASNATDAVRSWASA